MRSSSVQNRPPGLHESSDVIFPGHILSVGTEKVRCGGRSVPGLLPLPVLGLKGCCEKNSRHMGTRSGEWLACGLKDDTWVISQFCCLPPGTLDMFPNFSVAQFPHL